MGPQGPQGPQGIQGAPGLNSDSAARFQVSGNIGGDANIAIGPQNLRVNQIVTVAVPVDSRLVLSRARFNFEDPDAPRVSSETPAPAEQTLPSQQNL